MSHRHNAFTSKDRRLLFNSIQFNLTIHIATMKRYKIAADNEIVDVGRRVGIIRL